MKYQVLEVNQKEKEIRVQTCLTLTASPKEGHGDFTLLLVNISSRDIVRRKHFAWQKTQEFFIT